MKSYKIIFALLIIVIIIGCAAQNKMRYGIYRFSHNDQEYLIESYTPPNGVGDNFLILKDDNKVILKAVDNKQNGYIDKILIGDITLSKARKIYSYGLEKCSKSGKMETKFSEKSYNSEDVSNKYFLTTYSINSNDIYNKFTVIKKLDSGYQKELVFIDHHSDGSLNEVITGLATVDEYQEEYKNMLEKGVKQGEISNIEGKYVVVTTK